MADIETSATTAASQRPALCSDGSSHLPEFWLTRLAEVHVVHPCPVFPLPVTDGWNAGSWAFSRASPPAVTGSARQEWERVSSTRPELTVDHSRPSISVISLPQCDFMSHLDLPVPADPGGELVGRGLVRGQVGDGVDGLGVPAALAAGPGGD